MMVLITGILDSVGDYAMLGRNEIYEMDALDLLGALDDASVDMVLCDLPYGVTACAWDSIIPIEPMWEQLKRVIKKRGAIVLTATQPFASMLISSNYEMFKYEWVWDKVRPFGYLDSKYRPMKRHEDVLVFSSGGASNGSNYPMRYYPQGVRDTYKTVKRGTGNIFNSVPKASQTVVTTENYPTSILVYPVDVYPVHPTQKPVALFEYLIKTYTQEGELVVDMTCGSGTTAVAARKCGRDFICGDLSAEYVAVARKRLQDSDPYQPTELEGGYTQLSLFYDPVGGV